MNKPTKELIFFETEEEERCLQLASDTPARTAKGMMALSDVPHDVYDFEVHTGSGWVMGHRTDPPVNVTFTMTVRVRGTSTKNDRDALGWGIKKAVEDHLGYNSIIEEVLSVAMVE